MGLHEEQGAAQPADQIVPKTPATADEVPTTTSPNIPGKYTHVLK